MAHYRRGKIRSLEKYDFFFHQLFKVGKKWEKRTQRANLRNPGAAGWKPNFDYVFFVLTKLTNLLLFKCIKHVSGRIDVTIGNSNARKNPTHGDFKSHGVFGNNPKKNPIRKSLLLKTPRRFLIELDSRVCVIVELDSPIIEIIGE